MRSRCLRFFVAWLGLAAVPAFVLGEDVVTLESVPEKMGKITGDEPVAAEFSAEKAARYLDRAALIWQKDRKCAACHTNMAYLFARPVLGGVLEDSGEVRKLFEDYPTGRWKTKPPAEKRNFWPIVIGAGLTFNDLQTTGELSGVAREVLDLMWTVQRDDGGWNWPHDGYPPMEIDDHYGVTLAALTVGIAPGGYAETEAAQAGLAKVRAYLEGDPPKSLHHRAMIAWCSKRIDGIATDEQRAATLAELLALQRPDGGWATPGLLADWKGLAREDGEPFDTKTSDAYATGLVIVIARELGVAADDPRLKRGIGWLKLNQRESGKWFTRSPAVAKRNLISNTGSAFAVLALQACGELPGWPFEGEE